MKTPRVKDFDPDTKVPTLKSSLEDMPAIVKAKPKPQNKSSDLEKNIQPQQPIQSLPERPNDVTPVRPNGKRIITRNSFEIYEDQMDSLRKLSYHEKMEGKLGSMSQMVRTAIDEYLHKKATR